MGRISIAVIHCDRQGLDRPDYGQRYEPRPYSIDRPTYLYYQSS